MAISKLIRKYGSVNAATPQSVIAVELRGKGEKRLTDLICSFAPVGGGDPNVKMISRLIIVKSAIENIKFSLDSPLATIEDSAIIFDKFIYGYNGFDYLCSNFVSDENGALTILLYSPHDENANPIDAVSSLTVSGFDNDAKVNLKVI